MVLPYSGAGFGGGGNWAAYRMYPTATAAIIDGKVVQWLYRTQAFVELLNMTFRT
jgi:hypothetical protein